MKTSNGAPRFTSEWEFETIQGSSEPLADWEIELLFGYEDPEPTPIFKQLLIEWNQANRDYLTAKAK